MKDLIDWLTSRNTGTSSMNMARVHAGLPMVRSNQPPGDIHDFRRCADLVERVPGVRDSFPRIAECSPVWERFIANWDKLLVLLHRDDGEGMQKFINSFHE